MSPWRLLPLLLPVVLGGCELAPTRADGCGPGFDTRGAKSLNLRGYSEVGLRINPRSACRTNADGSQSTYQVLSLPKYRSPYYVQVISYTIDRELFAPVVATLDAQGKVARWIAPSKYVYRGDQLTGEIFFNRENAGETHLVVMSNPRRVGETDERIEQGEQTLQFGIGAWYGGRDKAVEIELTEFGELSVRARPDPSVDD